MHNFLSSSEVVHYTIHIPFNERTFDVNGFSTSQLSLGLIIDHVSGKDSGLINLPFHALLDEEIISISKSRRENPLNVIL